MLVRILFWKPRPKQPTTSPGLHLDFSREFQIQHVPGELCVPSPCTPAHWVSGVASLGKQHHQLPKLKTWAVSELLFVGPEIHPVPNSCHLYLLNSSYIHSPLPTPLFCFNVWILLISIPCYSSYQFPGHIEPSSVFPMCNSLPF